MVVPIFLLGVFYGLIYRLFALQSKSRVIGFGIATSILIVGASNVGASNVKLIGGNVMAVIAMLILRKYLLSALAQWVGIGRPGRG